MKNSLGEQRLRRKEKVNDIGLLPFRIREVERSETGKFNIGEGLT